MAFKYSRTASLALIFGHIAGMIDLSALPIWVNTLISGYGYRPLMAGALPSIFLFGAVAASVILARRFSGGKGRLLAPVGYWVAAACMLAVPTFDTYTARLVLHLIAGISIGVSLSTVHGTMGKTENPHRTFAIAYIGFGFFSLLFLGGVPQLTNTFGPDAFFFTIGGVFVFAAVLTTLFMPSTASLEIDPLSTGKKLSRPVRYVIAGFTCMSLIQAMVFSFIVQTGTFHGFELGNIQMMLIVLGVFNLFPAAIAAIFQKRLRAISVAKIGPLLQAACALIIMTATVFPAYAIAAIIFPAIQVFTHTFIFGFLAHNDKSGRATSATPAMLMAGSAIAPFLGGALAEIAGFTAIGVAAVVVGLIATVFFRLADREAAATGSADSSEA